MFIIAKVFYLCTMFANKKTSSKQTIIPIFYSDDRCILKDIKLNGGFEIT
jgi:hypothetical protein